MVPFITEIVNRFGGRYFGSEQEKQAQIYTKEVLNAGLQLRHTSSTTLVMKRSLVDFKPSIRTV